MKIVKAKTKKPVVKSAPARSLPKAKAKKVAAKKPSRKVVATKKPIALHRELTTEIIAARAYVIWEQKGRPQGCEVENWLLAETQLKQEIQSFTA